MPVEIESVRTDVREAERPARSIAESLTSREWNQLVDIVVRRMERRIADDLARRGRRVSTRMF